MSIKIYKIYGEVTIKFSTRTRPVLIKFFIKKEAADTVEKWTTENLRNEVKENSGIELKVDSKLMKEHTCGNAFLLCFASVEHYLKCERNVLLQYQKFPMRIYHRRLDEEPMTYKLKKIKADAENSMFDSSSEAKEPDS